MRWNVHATLQDGYKVQDIPFALLSEAIECMIVTCAIVVVFPMKAIEPGGEIYRISGRCKPKQNLLTGLNCS